MDHGRRNRRGRKERDPDKDRARMHPVREDEQSSSRKTTARARIRRRGDRENGIREDPEKDRAQCVETKRAARGRRRLGRAEFGRARRRPGGENKEERTQREWHTGASRATVEEEDGGKFLTARGQHEHCTRDKHH